MTLETDIKLNAILTAYINGNIKEAMDRCKCLPLDAWLHLPLFMKEQGETGEALIRSMTVWGTETSKDLPRELRSKKDKYQYLSLQRAMDNLLDGRPVDTFRNLLRGARGFPERTVRRTIMLCLLTVHKKGIHGLELLAKETATGLEDI